MGRRVRPGLWHSTRRVLSTRLSLSQTSRPTARLTKRRDQVGVRWLLADGPEPIDYGPLRTPAGSARRWRISYRTRFQIRQADAWASGEPQGGRLGRRGTGSGVARNWRDPLLGGCRISTLLDGPSYRTRHLDLPNQDAHDAVNQPARISGNQPAEFPEPTCGKSACCV